MMYCSMVAGTPCLRPLEPRILENVGVWGIACRGGSYLNGTIRASVIQVGVGLLQVCFGRSVGIPRPRPSLFYSAFSSVERSKYPWSLPKTLCEIPLLMYIPRIWVLAAPRDGS